MLTSILSNNEPKIASGLAHILSRVDYPNLQKQLLKAQKVMTKTHYIVLFQYVHSPMHVSIAEMERLPNSTEFVHDFLKRREVENALECMFATTFNMSVYSRRKVDNDIPGLDGLTKYRQVILKIDPVCPPSELDEAFDLGDDC